MKDLHSGLIKALFIILIVLSAHQIQSQNLSKQDMANLQEMLFFETNGAFFIPGESILVSLDCILANGEVSPISKVAYIELIDKDQKSVLQKKVQLIDGKGSGNFYLPTYLKTGGYTLIAYTRWMKNYSNDFVPQKRIGFANPYASFSRDFFKADSALTVEIDFFPESGYYVLGKKQKIAFRARDKYKGSPIPVDGQITNSSGESVASFKSLSGTGFFELTPQNDNYRAVLVDDKGAVSFHDIAIEPTARIALSVESNKSTLTIYRPNSADISRIFLQNNGKVLRELSFNSDNVSISKNTLPVGLSWVIAMDQGDNRALELPLINPAQKTPVTVALNKSTYKPREEVSLSIDLPQTEVSGQYTLSVRKQFPFKGESIVNQFFFKGLSSEEVRKGDPWHIAMDKKVNPTSTELPSSPTYLPDLRGNIVEGSLINDDQQPISNTAVALSVPSTGYKLATGTTNDTGEFYLITNEPEESGGLIFYADEEQDNTNLSINPPFFNSYEFVSPWEFYMSENDKEWLLEKSIAIQVENAYYDASDRSSLSSLLKSDFFPEENTEIYDLDDYTRFPTVEDAIREFVSEAWLRKTDDGALFSVPYTPNKSGEKDTTLVLLNGIPVDPDWILQLNPLEIDKIEVYQQQIMIGPWEFRGIINFQLYEFDTDRLNLPKNYKEVSYELPDDFYRLQFPEYSNGGNPRIPDFRSQLYWKPNLSLGAAEKITFYTSDNLGTYEVVLSGIIDGKSYVLEQRTFEVKE